MKDFVIGIGVLVLGLTVGLGAGCVRRPRVERDGSGGWHANYTVRCWNGSEIIFDQATPSAQVYNSQVIVKTAQGEEIVITNATCIVTAL